MGKALKVTYRYQQRAQKISVLDQRQMVVRKTKPHFLALIGSLSEFHLIKPGSNQRKNHMFQSRNLSNDTMQCKKSAKFEVACKISVIILDKYLIHILQG